LDLFDSIQSFSAELTFSSLSLGYILKTLQNDMKREYR